MISIVTPVFNEEDNVIYFHDEVTKVMESLPIDYEIIYVDDDPGTALLNFFCSCPAVTAMSAPYHWPAILDIRLP